MDQIARFRAQAADSLNFKVSIDIYTWRLSSQILSSFSRYFDAACNGGFREAQEHAITLHEDDPVVFCHFLQWLYTGRIVVHTDVKPRCVWNDEKEFLSVGELLALGKVAPGPDDLRAPAVDTNQWINREHLDAFAKVLSSLFVLADKYTLPLLAYEVIRTFTRAPESTIDSYNYRTERFWACRGAFVALGFGTCLVTAGMFANVAARDLIDGNGNMELRMGVWYGTDRDFAAMVGMAVNGQDVAEYEPIV